MGGLGSGRQYGGSRYLATERCYGLDLAALRRVGYVVPGREASGAWRWYTGDNPEPSGEVEVAIDLRNLDDPAFRITYKVGDEPLEIRGCLVTSTPQYGGVRYWFACPRCGMRRRVLYAYPQLGRHRFACRRCHGLRYYSHRESRLDRLSRKAKKLWGRAGSRDGREHWQKPKWMRWATFSRLVLAGRAAQEEVDAIVLHQLGIGLARIQAMHRGRQHRGLR
jgi:hypothetical protein